jgi:hypothetical protein
MTLERRVVKLETARRARQCAASSELVLVFETEDKATFRLSDGWHECRRADDESFAQFEARALADMRPDDVPRHRSRKIRTPKSKGRGDGLMPTSGTRRALRCIRCARMTGIPGLGASQTRPLRTPSRLPLFQRPANRRKSSLI